MEFLVLLGSPGSGKGTLGRSLREKHGFIPVSTGEVIRKEMADAASDIGCQSRPYMDRGDYIPDELALSLFFKLMDRFSFTDRLVLDGFPRTVPQAERFHNWVSRETDHTYLGCVYLDVPVEVAVRRMEERRICEQCRCPYHLQDRPPVLPEVCDECGGRLIPREDDDPDRIRQRMFRHREQTRPLRGWFAERAACLELDGRTEPDELVRIISQSILSPTPGDAHGENNH